MAWNKYSKGEVGDSEAAPKGLLENKWYVDEVYDFLFVKPVKAMGSFFSAYMDKKVIDGAVNGMGKLVQYSGRQVRLLQSGSVGSYILLMVLSIFIVFLCQFFLRK